MSILTTTLSEPVVELKSGMIHSLRLGSFTLLASDSVIFCAKWPKSVSRLSRAVGYSIIKTCLKPRYGATIFDKLLSAHSKE